MDFAQILGRYVGMCSHRPCELGAREEPRAKSETRQRAGRKVAIMTTNSKNLSRRDRNRFATTADGAIALRTLKRDLGHGDREVVNQSAACVARQEAMGRGLGELSPLELCS